MRKLTMLLSLVLICALLLGAAGLPASAEAVLADELGYLVSGEDGSLLLSEGGELYLDTSGRSFEAPDDNYRVFYEIFTGSFSDSDGDGVGDLRGIINRMDYLNDGDPASGLSLGVEGLWLTPIFESPTYHKYDVTDYYRVDDQFGTLEDLRELIELCHARGVKLILDLPINHSGDQNEWFEKFRLAHITGNDENAYYDFYSFVQSADGKGVPAGYKQIGSTKDYYECNFSEHMPEFNFDSEAVRQEMLNIARFYLDMGVDGFRFDAAKYIYLGDNGRSGAFWDWYLAELRAIKPDIYTVAEVWDADGVTDAYYSAVNCFDFTTSLPDRRERRHEDGSEPLHPLQRLALHLLRRGAWPARLARRLQQRRQPPSGHALGRRGRHSGSLRHDLRSRQADPGHGRRPEGQ